jgi:hypothetical protein
MTFNAMHNIQGRHIMPIHILPIHRVGMTNLVSIINRHLYLSGMWLGVAPNMDTKKQNIVFRRDWITCSNDEIILRLIVDIIRAPV